MSRSRRAGGSSAEPLMGDSGSALVKPLRAPVCSRACGCALRCAGACSVPVRFIFALLALMSAGLLLMTGASCVAQVEYGVQLPVLTGAAVTAIPATVVLGTTLFASVLIVEVTAALITTVSAAIGYVSFSSWQRQQWRVLGAAARRRGSDAGAQRELASYRGALSGHAVADAAEALVAAFLVFSAALGVMAASSYPLVDGPQNPTYSLRATGALPPTSSLGFETCVRG